MNAVKRIATAGLTLLLLCAGGASQDIRQRRAPSQTTLDGRGGESRLTGLYRIDISSSDTLYSAVADVSSSLPYREQQRFFIDLAVRLTPPDQFSIEQRGRSVSIASSRARRITFEADGVMHTERAADGDRIHTRALLRGDRLVVSTDGAGNDKFSVSFEPLDNGRRLLVVRQIHAKELNEPVVIRSVYEKISEVAHWGIYGEPEGAPDGRPELAAGTKVASARAARNDATVVQATLEEWVAATNERDIRRHLSFYMPRLKAFYLARDVPRDMVRTERARAFHKADLIEIRALTPETVFVDNGQVAIMRFRKQYATRRGSQNHRGEVIQELRWRRTDGGWKIFSERDIKVLR